LENFGMSHASALLCSCNIQEREHRWGDHQDMRVQVGHVWLVCPDLQQAHRKSYHLWVKLEDSAAVDYLWSLSLSQTAMYQLPLWLWILFLVCFSWLLFLYVKWLPPGD
jgi:hypothetical protein